MLVKPGIRFQINPILPANHLWRIYYYRADHSQEIKTEGLENIKFIEENWQYIRETAEVKAVEIAQKTRRFEDVPDYMQDMFLVLCKRIIKYNSDKSNIKTFVNICLSSAKIGIIRRMFRQKNILIKQAMETEYER